jgi:N-acetylglutamate synthase-like GNAT family acetyltransferase
VSCRPASVDDAPRIVELLRANCDDPSMFVRSQSDVRAHVRDFLIAEDDHHRTVGCAAFHEHSAWLAELLSVAVEPSLHGLGVGSALVEESLEQAAQRGGLVFLATAKPEYFSRFGFTPISKWVLPAGVLVDKFAKVLAQPIRRWIPSLLGRHTFMAWHSQPTGHARDAVSGGVASA